MKRYGECDGRDIAQNSCSEHRGAPPLCKIAWHCITHD